jgi:hypothetical protein
MKKFMMNNALWIEEAPPLQGGGGEVFILSKPLQPPLAKGRILKALTEGKLFLFDLPFAGIIRVKYL